MNAKQIRTGAIVAILVVVVLVGGVALYADSLARDSYTSEYTYDGSVSADGTLTNVTILLPAPALDGESAVAAEIESGDGYLRPETASSRVVETEHGPMLAVTVDEFAVEPAYYRFVEDDELGRVEEIDADEYDPDDPDTFVRERESIDLTLRLESDEAIDTREPIGAEPLLEPRFDTTETPCQGDAGRCYEYASLAGLEYGADPDTTVSASVTFRGENAWWTGGWNGNWYEERVTVEATGAQAGWVPASGELEAGRGSYR